MNTLFSALSAAFNFTVPSGSGLESVAAKNKFQAMYGTGSFIGTGDPEAGGAPKAFINYILFDESFNLLDFGFDQVDASGAQTLTGPVVSHDQMALHIQVQKKGYLYIFISNESPNERSVYFDDLKIVRHTYIESVSDYYPFGLAFNSYQRENLTPQDYKFNQKEEQTELDLGWLDYGLRMYQPELGRWNGIDPLAEKYLDVSPFAYVANNPILFIDPNGAEIWLSFTCQNEDGDDVTTRLEYRGDKLYKEDGDEYDGSDGADPIFQMVKDQLNSIKEMTQGNKEVADIFSTLEATEWDHDIIIDMEAYNPEAATPEERHENYNEEDFVGSTTHYNPTMKEDTEHGGERDSRIGLLHELRHSYDKEKGTYKGTSGGISSKTGKYRDVSTWEYRAVNAENILRKALGEPRRTTYGGVTVPSNFLKN